MMQQDTARLQEASRLIKAGDTAQARRILRTVLKEDQNNWQAWWGLVHAANDPKERLIALRKTVQLNPDHGKANALLDKVKARRRAQAQQQAAPEPGAFSQEPVTGSSPFDAPDPVSPWQDEPFATADNAAAPWDNPFDNAAANNAPWDDPFAGVSDDGGSPWETASDSGFERNSDFATGAEEPLTVKPKSGGQSDKIINIAIGVVVVLIVLILGGVLLSQVDLGGFSLSLGGSGGATGGIPNYYTGGDPFDTVGGGYLTIDGGSARAYIGDLFDAHNWAFEASGGQRVLITAQGVGGTDPRITLLGPGGNVITSNDDNGSDYGLGMWDAVIEYTIPSTGTYTARVDVFSTGDYDIAVFGN